MDHASEPKQGTIHNLLFDMFTHPKGSIEPQNVRATRICRGLSPLLRRQKSISFPKFSSIRVDKYLENCMYRFLQILTRFWIFLTRWLCFLYLLGKHGWKNYRMAFYIYHHFIALFQMKSYIEMQNQLEWSNLSKCLFWLFLFICKCSAIFKVENIRNIISAFREIYWST